MDAIALLTLPPPGIIVPFCSGVLLGGAFFGSAMFYIGWCAGEDRANRAAIKSLRGTMDKFWGIIPEIFVDLRQRNSDPQS